jgi:hypothetical protein
VNQAAPRFASQVGRRNVLQVERPDPGVSDGGREPLCQQRRDPGTGSLYCLGEQPGLQGFKPLPRTDIQQHVDSALFKPRAVPMP